MHRDPLDLGTFHRAVPWKEECWEHPALEWAAAPFSDKLEMESCEVPALGRRFLAVSSSFMRNMLCQGTIRQRAVGFLFFNGLLIRRPQR